MSLIPVAEHDERAADRTPRRRHVPRYLWMHLESRIGAIISSKLLEPITILKLETTLVRPRRPGETTFDPFFRWSRRRQGRADRSKV